tara:strand:+ start:15275 stop:16219 length:945 start_codon:yes stop_codon:yes gene_type:complete
MKQYFTITIDTEADDAWSNSRRITFKNFEEIPRFQSLCEKYNIFPTYLLTYEYATFKPAVKYLKEKLDNGKCEIGMHLHSWTTPPFSNNKNNIDVDWLHAYQYELPDRLFEEKAEMLFKSIIDSFGKPPTSHRAGRWGIDERTIDWLVEKEFKVDSSVVPGVNYMKNIGKKLSGPDFRFSQKNPYVWETSNNKKILEVPVTVQNNKYLNILSYFSYLHILEKIKNKINPNYIFRPNPNVDLVKYDRLLKKKFNIYNMMIHSSELALDCSPFTKNKKDYNYIWDIIEFVFKKIDSSNLNSITLSETKDVYSQANE